ncbi:uncharacterized protein LOC125665326 [Ostrea edulis]|uniref:uncharacterized protein LOC125665326 n=1 Tax=Ostrea edulis TaxID=37623 RepID=UPI0024AFDFA6|nr:uncharacterized protein LOC125665326 [Ostrea edulis]
MDSLERRMSPEKVSSSSSRNRKNMKPVMERKRRARINTSLAELKSLLIEVIQSEGARQNKMEKADILELTVRHLGKVKRKQPLVPESESTSRMNKYRLGFSECAVEVSKYLEHTIGLETDFRARLLNHLVEVSMNTGQDNENRYHPMRASTVPNRSHQNPLLEDSSEYCQEANKDTNHTIGSAGRYPETIQKKEIDNNGNYVMRNKEAEQMPASSMKDIYINTTHISSGDMAFLVPAGSLLQYSGNTMPGPKVFLQVIQPQSSNSINASISDGNITKVSAGMTCPGNIVASQTMGTPFAPNMTFGKQILNPVCSFIQVVPKEYTHAQASDSQSECAHIQPSDSQSECAHIQPSDSQSVGRINENAHFSALQNRVAIKKSPRNNYYDKGNCSISGDCLHEEVKTAQVWRPW